MKNMKKALAMLLALTMILALCACGSKTEETKPADDQSGAADATEITLWTYPIGGWGDENGIQNPQQMAMAMSVEMGEMLEHFAWLDADGVQRLLAGDMPKRRENIAEEFADVLIYGLQVMNALHVDIADAVLSKVDIVRQRAVDPDAGRTHPHRHDD